MESAFRTILTRLFMGLAVVALLTGIGWAQAGTGQLAGLVTDPTGAVVANTQLTLINTATGERRTTTTTAGGDYRFSALPVVGTYRLELAPKGFKGVKIADIVISVGTTVTRDIKLEIGTGSEEVTVEAGAEVVQTTESALSQLVDRNIWQSMPLEVRNQNSFIELIPGAVPQDDQGVNNRGAAVNGARQGAGNYLVEGVDNYEQGQAGRGQISIFDKGGAAVSISPDAIQEYRVITNDFAAEYGKSGGFITDTVLKSGTNKWHGSVFEYNRVQALAANDWFSNEAQIRDHLVRNQFGGSIGGAIVPNKTFIYGVGEVHRARWSFPITTTSTTPQFLNFVKTGGLENWAETSPNGICNNQSWWDNNLGDGTPGSSGVTAAPCVGALSMASTTGPTFNKLYATQPYPLANGGPYSSIGAGAWTTGLVFPVPVYGQTTVSNGDNQDEERFSVKFDQIFSDKDKFSVVYLYQRANSLNQYGGGWNTIGPPGAADGRGQDIGLNWNHNFSPTVLNTARFGYLRHRTDFPPVGTELGIPQYGTEDGMGVDFGLYGGLPQWFTENQFQYMDSLAFVRGKHSFKTGVEYRRIRNGSTFDNDRFSSVYPWGIEDTMTDLAFSDQVESVLTGSNADHAVGGAYYMSAAVNPTTGQSPDFYRGFRANEYAAYFQDDWRMSNTLTLNLGLRWDYFGPPHNFQSNMDSNFYFGSPVTPVPTATDNPYFPVNSPFYASVATGSFQVRNHVIWNKDTNNFGPRLGFAWDPMGKAKFVVRGGFGIAYDRIYNNVFENIRFNPPYYSDNQIGYAVGKGAVGPISTPGLFTYPFTSLSLFNDPLYAPKPNPRHMDQNMVTPYYEQAHLGVQWEFARGYVFEPEYVGNFGHKLIGLLDINTFDGREIAGVAHDRIDPNIGADNFRNNGFDSNYHSLQLTLRKAYGNGLGFNVNYTYSKALDDMSDLFNSRAGGHPTDNMNIRNDYGLADFDRRQRVVATLTYEVPFLKENRWLGGWGANTIISRQTGAPFSPYDGSRSYDLNQDGYFTDRIVPVAGDPMSTINNNISPAGNPNNPDAGGYLKPNTWETYTCPATVHGGLWCDPPTRRNSITGPGFVDVDFNVTKRFRVTEGSGVTFQANFFDLFNHPNFYAPVSDLNNPLFGLSQSTAGDTGGHRVVQLALRFDF